MIAEITQWIMELMRAHGQLSVFIGVMIEQIVVPIPSPLIIMGAGAILILPELSIPDAFLQILWIIVLPGHSCLPYLSGLYFCRTLPHFWVQYSGAWSLGFLHGGSEPLTKRLHSFGFCGAHHLHFYVHRNGGCLCIPLLRIQKVDLIPHLLFSLKRDVD